jgi:hypothetical protein
MLNYQGRGKRCVADFLPSCDDIAKLKADFVPEENLFTYEKFRANNTLANSKVLNRVKGVHILVGIAH